MKRENAIFLAVGFAFGALFGLGLFNAMQGMPDLQANTATSTATGPQGPKAPDPSAAAPAGGAPMMAEIRALRDRIAQNPQDDAALVRLANLYHDASMFQQAIEFYEQALAVKPDEPDWLTDLGTCYRGTQQFDKALDAFRRAQQVDPQHWQSLFNIAVVAGFDLGQFDAALTAVEQLERMNPAPPRVAELRQALEQARSQGAES